MMQPKSIFVVIDIPVLKRNYRFLLVATVFCNSFSNIYREVGVGFRVTQLDTWDYIFTFIRNREKCRQSVNQKENNIY